MSGGTFSLQVGHLYDPYAQQGYNGAAAVSATATVVSTSITATKGLKWVNTSRSIFQEGIGTVGLRVTLTGTSNDGHTFVGAPKGTYIDAATWVNSLVWTMSTVAQPLIPTVKRVNGGPDVDGYVYTVTTSWTTGIGIPYTPITRTIILTTSITVTIYADGTTSTSSIDKEVCTPWGWGEGWWRTRDWPK